MQGGPTSTTTVTLCRSTEHRRADERETKGKSRQPFLVCCCCWGESATLNGLDGCSKGVHVTAHAWARQEIPCFRISSRPNAGCRAKSSARVRRAVAQQLTSDPKGDMKFLKHQRERQTVFGPRTDCASRARKAAHKSEPRAVRARKATEERGGGRAGRRGGTSDGERRIFRNTMLSLSGNIGDSSRLLSSSGRGGAMPLVPWEVCASSVQVCWCPQQRRVTGAILHGVRCKVFVHHRWVTRGGGEGEGSSGAHTGASPRHRVSALGNRFEGS